MCCLMQQFPEAHKFLCDRLLLRQVEADQHENPLSLLLAGTHDVVHTVPGSRDFLVLHERQCRDCSHGRCQAYQARHSPRSMRGLLTTTYHYKKDPVIVSPLSGLEVDVPLLCCNNVAYLSPRAYAQSGFILLTWLVGGWRTNPNSTPRTIPYNPCTRPYTPFPQPQLSILEGSQGLQLGLSVGSVYVSRKLRELITTHIYIYITLPMKLEARRWP